MSATEKTSGRSKKADEAKDAKMQDAAENAPDKSSEDDVEGHNLFAMSDYYVQSKMGRQVDIERDARQRALLKEARANKKEGRR